MEKRKQDEFEEEPDGAPERIPTHEKRREGLQLNAELMGVVCAAFGHATSTQRSVYVRSKETQMN